MIVGLAILFGLSCLYDLVKNSISLYRHKYFIIRNSKKILPWKNYINKIRIVIWLVFELSIIIWSIYILIKYQIIE
jgi:hypothetical protein